MNKNKTILKLFNRHGVLCLNNSIFESNAILYVTWVPNSNKVPTHTTDYLF